MKQIPFLGFDNIVKLLIENGADLSLKTDAGNTARQIAVSQSKMSSSGCSAPTVCWQQVANIFGSLKPNRMKRLFLDFFK